MSANCMLNRPVFFSVIDQNDFEMTEKNKVVLVRMSENIG